MFERKIVTKKTFFLLVVYQKPNGRTFFLNIFVFHEELHFQLLRRKNCLRAEGKGVLFPNIGKPRVHCFSIKTPRAIAVPAPLQVLGS